MDLEYKKLIFKARRGMLELDLLLKRFLEINYKTLTSALSQQFEKLMDLQDPELLDLLIHENHQYYPEYHHLQNIIDLIIQSKNHAS